MNLEEVRGALEGHKPQGDYDGYVARCECGWGWRGTEEGSDYRNHAAGLITALKGDIQ